METPKVSLVALPELTRIGGTVFYDFDVDGLFDPLVPGEVPLAGWKIELSSAAGTFATFSDAGGHYEFLREPDGASYLLTSIAPAPGFIPAVGARWLATTPNPVPVTAVGDEVIVHFGNLHFENTPELARSKGYWHNQGEDELRAADPAWRELLNDMCLRTNKTSPPSPLEETFFTVPLDVDFDTAYDLLGEYLLGLPPRGVLAYTISTQFTAAILNHNFGALQLPTFIDQENDDKLVSLDQMIEHTHEMLCDPRTADTGPGSDPEWRAHLIMCTDEWNGMNTTGANLYTRSPIAPPVIYD